MEQKWRLDTRSTYLGSASKERGSKDVAASGSHVCDSDFPGNCMRWIAFRESPVRPGVGTTPSTCSPGGGGHRAVYSAEAPVKAVTWLSLPWLLCHVGSLEAWPRHSSCSGWSMCPSPEVTTSGAFHSPGVLVWWINDRVTVRV